LRPEDRFELKHPLFWTLFSFKDKGYYFMMLGHFVLLLSAATARSQLDKDECTLANGGCQHTCTNTDGSYKCSCYSGYQLKPDGLTCQDKDECMLANSGCQH
ncbi:unnamed protein product, partial [Porites evermanni]